MGMIESVLEKDGRDGNKFWIAIIDGIETMAFDSKIKELKGKECPYPIGMSKNGKPYIQFPKAGGFQKGGAGGGWKGKSDKEIFSTILTMSMAYAKDLVVAELNVKRIDMELDVQELCLSTYGRMSKLILADLAKLVPDTPKQTEAPKEAIKAPDKPPQDTSPPRTGTDKEAKTVKEKLEKKMWQYLANQHADNDQNFKALLMELTEFQGTNKQTGEPEKVFVDNMAKLSEKWAGSCMGKLEKLIEEEERKNMANAPGMEDVPY